MGAFKYEGTTREGKKVSGEIDATSAQEAKSLLRRKGIRAKNINKPNKIAELDLMVLVQQMTGSVGFGDKDLSRFTKQFSTLLDAGVPILQSLDILYKQEKNVGLKQALLRIQRGISEGKTLFDAIDGERGISNLYAQLIKAGESAGILDEIIAKLDIFLEKRIALKAKIKGAMTYPAIVLLVGIGVVAGLLTFVVPQFVSMLEGSGQEVPAITQLVIDVSEFFQNYILHLIVCGGAAVFAFKKYFFENEKGRDQWDKALMKAPVFKHIVIKGNLSAFAQTLSTMLASGIPLTECLEVCAGVMDNGVIAKDIRRVRLAVLSGKTMSEPLKRIEYFPDIIIQMINVGESTGLDSMLRKVADVFEVEVDGSINNMTNLIEPIMIVGLAIVVGTVLIAMYMPVFVAGGGI